jgi:hypothetical protein
MPESRRDFPKENQTMVLAPALGFEPASFPRRFERRQDAQASSNVHFPRIIKGAPGVV